MPSNDTPSLGDVIFTAIDTRLRNTGVALPGTIESYDAGAGTCTVKPGVNRMLPSFEDEDQDVSEELPSLQDVPVLWLVGRGIKVNGSLQPGDTVLLICLDRDMSGWLRTGKNQDPEDGRMHSWSNAVAIPGLVPQTSPFPTPTDAAALASALNLLIGILKAWAPVLPDGQALHALVLAAFPAVPTPTLTGTPPIQPPIFVAATTGSSVLLLDEPLLP